MSKVVKKLKAIRRLVKNIPAKNISLDRWVTTDGDTYQKSVMCPGAWITTDVFVGKGLFLEQEGSVDWWNIKYKKREDFDALAKFIGITEAEAMGLFDAASFPEEDGGNSHKVIFLKRITNLIEAYE